MNRLLDYYKSIKISKDDRCRYISYVYDTIYIPQMGLCEASNRMIELNPYDLIILNSFCKRSSEAKEGGGYGFDDDNRIKREMTGACCEYGILKYFGKEALFDDSIAKHPNDRNYPDLIPMGIICDVKGCFTNSVPLVFRDTRTYCCPEGTNKGIRYKCSNIICVTDHKKVWILGIASCETLKQYSDNNLIKNADNITKTGFYGVDKLDALPDSWDEFRILCKKYVTRV